MLRTTDGRSVRRAELDVMRSELGAAQQAHRAPIRPIRASQAGLTQRRTLPAVDERPGLIQQGERHERPDKAIRPNRAE
jgi:hypothetical protein